MDVGQPLIVMNLHLEAFDSETREIHTQRALDLFREYSYNYPVIMMGDFNSPPPFATGIEIEQSSLSGFYNASFVDSGIGEEQYRLNEGESLTFNSEEPYAKLDYIMYTPETITPLSARVVSEAGLISDHLPVILSFTFK